VNNKATHTFAAQLAEGQEGEAIIDRWLAARYSDIEPAVMKDQRRGIDRWATDTDGQRVGIEIKSDGQGHRTGNVFVETISVDRTGKPGWAFTSQADVLIYWLRKNGTGWLLDPATVRAKVWHWTRAYPVKTASNRDYHSYGVLVPTTEFDAIATDTLTLEP
jgi:hypothetical protein